MLSTQSQEKGNYAVSFRNASINNVQHTKTIITITPINNVKKISDLN